MMKKITALLLVSLLLAGCSAEGNVETLLRAPQLSGESAALQKALNSYLGGSATLKYPASGDFLSPFAFGDWDGDGVDEAAVLYLSLIHISVSCRGVSSTPRHQKGAKLWRSFVPKRPGSASAWTAPSS